MSAPRLILLLAIGLAGGCALWKKTPHEPSSLPAARMSPDSVVLEISLVDVPADARESLEPMWAEIDEQHLPFDVRRRLRANGIRCGLAGTQLPATLRQLLERRENRETVDPEEGAPRVGSNSTQQRIQSRAGRRNRIVTSETRPSMAVMTNDDDAVRGQTCQQAHCELALKTFPQGDGRVQLEITPEIQHGVPQQRIMGGDNAFRIVTDQERLLFDTLRMHAMLAPGQTLVLSCTPEMAGLGGQFFTNLRSGKAQPKLVLVRLEQTQYDDLFAPEQILPPIATPTE